MKKPKSDLKDFTVSEKLFAFAIIDIPIQVVLQYVCVTFECNISQVERSFNIFEGANMFVILLTGNNVLWTLLNVAIINMSDSLWLNIGITLATVCIWISELPVFGGKSIFLLSKVLILMLLVLLTFGYEYGEYNTRRNEEEQNGEEKMEDVFVSLL